MKLMSWKEFSRNDSARNLEGITGLVLKTEKNHKKKVCEDSKSTNIVHFWNLRRFRLGQVPKL